MNKIIIVSLVCFLALSGFAQNEPKTKVKTWIRTEKLHLQYPSFLLEYFQQ